MLALMSIKNRLTKRRLGDLCDMTRPHRCKVTDLPKRESMHNVTRRRGCTAFYSEGPLMLEPWTVNTSIRTTLPRYLPSRWASDLRCSSFPNLINLQQTGESLQLSSSVRLLQRLPSALKRWGLPRFPGSRECPLTRSRSRSAIVNTEDYENDTHCGRPVKLNNTQEQSRVLCGGWESQLCPWAAGRWLTGVLSPVSAKAFWGSQPPHKKAEQLPLPRSPLLLATITCLLGRVTYLLGFCRSCIQPSDLSLVSLCWVTFYGYRPRRVTRFLALSFASPRWGTACQRPVTHSSNQGSCTHLPRLALDRGPVPHCGCHGAAQRKAGLGDALNPVICLCDNFN